MTLAGRSGGGACPPTRIVRNADGSMRASAVGTSDVRVQPVGRGRASTAAASKPSCTVHGVPVTSDRVTTDSPPTWASGRQASQRSASGSTSSRALVARADASTAAWVRTTSLGSPVLPLVATTSASPSSTGSSRRAGGEQRGRGPGPGAAGRRGARRRRRPTPAAVASTNGVADGVEGHQARHGWQRTDCAGETRPP